MTAWINTCHHQLAVLIIGAVALVFSAAGGLIGGHYWSLQGWGEPAGLFVFAVVFFAWEGKVSLTKSQNQPR